MLLVLMAFPALHAQSYDNLWKQLEEAREKSLPQTVIRLADQIWQKAQTEKNAPQMLKAYVCRQACQKRITPDSLYTSLAAMERWAQEEADETNRAILHSLLARQYADLLSTNRRTLLNSPSFLVDEAPADVREWSLNLFKPPCNPSKPCCVLPLPTTIPSSSSRMAADSMPTTSTICWLAVPSIRIKGGGDSTSIR